ncbi:hypothetical protein [Nocardioides caldifontis]|uniref:hypothetical protein n=1 Tax=Nocardioides caldifontis TaxID=2588938 RepID=UPI0011E02396|nr:hypothetical protein [Nocardioides caldifontis]
MTTTVSTELPRPRTARSGLQAAGAAGVLSALVMLGAFLVLPPDSGGTSPEDIAARYAEGSAGYLRAAALETLSTALCALLVAGLAAWLLPRRPVAAFAVAAGGVVMVTCQLAGYAAIATLAQGAAESAGNDVVTAIHDLSALLFVVGSAGLALLTGAVAAAGLRGSPVLAAWSVVTCCAAAVGSVAFATDGLLSPHGDLGFLVLVLQLAWTVTAGVTLLRGSTTDGRTARR